MKDDELIKTKELVTLSVTLAFTGGAVFMYCALTLFKDYMGLAAYVGFVREFWVTPMLTVPLSSVTIIVCLWFRFWLSWRVTYEFRCD